MNDTARPPRKRSPRHTRAMVRRQMRRAAAEARLLMPWFGDGFVDRPRLAVGR